MLVSATFEAFVNFSNHYNIQLYLVILHEKFARYAVGIQYMCIMRERPSRSRQRPDKGNHFL